MGSSSSTAAGQKKRRSARPAEANASKDPEPPEKLDSPTVEMDAKHDNVLRQQLQSKQAEVEKLSEEIKLREKDNQDLKETLKIMTRELENRNIPETADGTETANSEITKCKESMKSKDFEIAELQKKLHNLKIQKDKQIEVLKETIEKIIREKDFKLRRLEAMCGETEHRQGIIPNYTENMQGQYRFGISAEIPAQNDAKVFLKMIRDHGEAPESEFEIGNIRRAFRKNIFLSNLGKSQIEELTRYMEKAKMKAGEVIIKDGDNGSYLYVIEEGEVNVVKEQDNQLLATLPPGCVFGELAVLYNCKRTATVRAKTDVVVWLLSRQNFQSIVQRSGEKLRKAYIALLKQVPQFSELSEEKITRICDCLVKENFAAGEYIIRQGEVGDTFYIVSDGKVKITKNVDQSQDEEFLSYVERGGFFGERALLSDERRAANVIADTDVICLTMDRQAFTSLIGQISMSESYTELHGVEKSSKSSSDSRTGEQFECGYGVPKSDREIILATSLEDITILKPISKGGFGSVSLVAIKSLGDRPLALKKIRKAFIAKMGQERHVVEERKLLMSMLSPFICRLYRTYKDEHYVYMLMDAYLGGDIFMYMKHRGPFREDGAKFVTACVVEALGYLHSRGIAYRDMKPENLMIDERGYVKLIDLGFAKKMAKGSKTWTFCGTPEYFPPEILQNSGHDYSADYWSLGILAYELLTGTTPFFANDEMTVYANILDGIERVKFRLNVPKNAELFVRNLCKLDPQNRLGNSAGGFNEIRKHRWFRGFHWEGMRRQLLSSPIDSTVADPTKSNYLDASIADKEDPDIGETPDCSSWDFDF